MRIMAFATALLGHCRIAISFVDSGERLAKRQGLTYCRLGTIMCWD